MTLSQESSSEHQDLLQFLYQFPVGVIALDDDGVVATMNPAASRFLSPETLPHESLIEPLPVLQRLVPELMTSMLAEPERLGMVPVADRQVVDGSDGVTRFEVTAHRVRRNQVLVSLTDVSEERRILADQRERALRLQRALLGQADPTDLQLSVAYVPAHRGDLAGGDWYDVIRLSPDRYGLVVGDVVGHDIEASATMGQLRALVRAHAMMDADPAKVVRRTEAVAENIDSALCATLNYVVLEKSTGKVSYSSAGHPPPLIVRADGSTEMLTEGHRPALAVLPEAPNRVAEAFMAPGDLLLLYTDGLVEKRGESLDHSLERLASTASDVAANPSMDRLAGMLVAAMVPDGTQRDDICLVAVRHTAT